MFRLTGWFHIHLFLFILASNHTVSLSASQQTGDAAPTSEVPSQESEAKVEEEPFVIRSAFIPAPAPPPMDPMYPPAEGSTHTPATQEVYDALKVFGYDSFRPGQEQAVMRILAGKSIRPKKKVVCFL